jgi:hypothetical protein
MNAIFITLLHIIAFFGIGLLVASILESRNIINKHFIVIAAYGVSSLVCYGLFYIYIVSPQLGTYGTGVFYTAGLLAAFYLVYRLGLSARLRKTFTTAVLPVLAIIIVLSTMYSAITFSCHYRKVPPNSPWVFYHSCVLYNSTGDNVIAQFFGQKILDKNAGALMGDWHLADRPPLEIGNVISLLDVLPNDNAQRSAYEFFSIVLQLSWVAALWALLKVMKARKQEQLFVIFISALTGFYYYNSIYAWPKLLAASFGIAGLALLIYHSKNLKTASAKDWVVATVFLVLSILAHGSAFYLLIPLALYILFSRRLPPIKVLAVCAAVGLVLYGPWMIYEQHTAPNPRLIKWQLANVVPASDTRSAPKAIVDSYEHITFKNWLDGRVNNVSFLIKGNENLYGYHGTNPYTMLVHIAKDPTEHSLLDRIRKQEFFALVPALGILNVGWLVLIYNKYKKRKNRFEVQPLLVISVSGILIWALLLLVPDTTVNHANSYGLITLLFTGLILSVLSSPTIKKLVMYLQPIIFYLVWVFGLYKINSQWYTLLPVTALMLFYGALAMWWYRSAGSKDQASA